MPRPTRPPMPDPGAATATGRLLRLLHIIPAAAREGGVSLDDLSRELEVDRATIEADLEDLKERSYRLHAGSAGDLQLSHSADRIEIWSPGAFRRPVRLSGREALALGLGLRMAALSPSAGSSAGPSPEREALRRRLEAHLATAPLDGELDRFGAPELGPHPDPLLDTLTRCAAEHCVCEITYLKPGDEEPDRRRVHPLSVTHAEAGSYLLGFCESAGEPRAFRIDRILEVDRTGGRFAPDPDFDPALFIEGGRVFRAEPGLEAVVRLTGAAARDHAERHWAEGPAPEDPLAAPDSVEVRVPVADPRWLVRYILSQGGEAEVVAPAALRRRVSEGARALAAPHAPLGTPGPATPDPATSERAPHPAPGRSHPEPNSPAEPE
jgi:proteasome accessory factor C